MITFYNTTNFHTHRCNVCDERLHKFQWCRHTLATRQALGGDLRVLYRCGIRPIGNPVLRHETAKASTGKSREMKFFKWNFGLNEIFLAKTAKTTNELVPSGIQKQQWMKLISWTNHHNLQTGLFICRDQWMDGDHWSFIKTKLSNENLWYLFWKVSSNQVVQYLLPLVEREYFVKSDSVCVSWWSLWSGDNWYKSKWLGINWSFQDENNITPNIGNLGRFRSEKKPFTEKNH